MVGGFVGLRAVDKPSTLTSAVAKLEDSDRFATSLRAGQTVADISAALRVDGAKCRAENDTAARCDAILSASAFTAVAAVRMLDCTAPDVFEARRALLAYLRQVRAFIGGDATGAPPTIPKVVAC